MSRQRPIEVFTPPNMLKARLTTGGTGGGIDTMALRRAEAAVEAMQSDFAEWLAADIGALSEAIGAYLAAPHADRLADIYRRAHDLKGQGASLNFPLISRIGASLCALIDGLTAKKAPPQKLISAHVDTIKAIVRDNIRDADDRAGMALARELETQVADFLEA